MLPVQVTTTAELIEAGYLSPFRVYAPSHPDFTGVRTVAGDFHEGDLGEAMNPVALVADVVETWGQHGENRPTFVFAVDRAHAKHLQARFEAGNVRCGYIDAYTKGPEREALFRQFTAGEIKVIASVGWSGLVPILGVESRYLVRKQGPCPICSGKTRFRFDDKEGRGTWICNHCGAGDGADLAMKVLGIAEGIETALAAASLFSLPVWAALDAGMMAKWEPPAEVREIIVFGDADPGFIGQEAAYALARRLARQDRMVTVRLPPQIGEDWNDVLHGQRQVQA